MPQLIRKLRSLENEIEATAARALALTIARNGLLVPRERAMLISDWTLRQSSILVAHLLKRVVYGEEREALADVVFAVVQPLPFGLDCLRWIRHDKKEPEEERIISPAAEEKVLGAMAERIRGQTAESPLYQTFGRDAPWLYWFWNKQDGGEAVGTHLRTGLRRIRTRWTVSSTPSSAKRGAWKGGCRIARILGAKRTMP